MDTLENMRMFVRVVEAGSFTKAASQADVGTAQVSRSIADLEARLNTRLLHRTTRQMSLTEAGERYLHRCEQILSYIDLAEAEAAGATAMPSGRLRVHSTNGFGQHYLAPLIAQYYALYPDVAIDLVLAQRMPDIIEEGFDVSIVVARELPDSALVSQRIGAAFTILCASPHYVARCGPPLTLDDLNHHTCLHLQLPDIVPGEWIFETHERDAAATVFRHRHTTPLTVNVSEALAETIRAGMGIGPLPLSVALPSLRDGSLVRVLPQYRLRTNNVYALYASRHYLDAKIKTFVEFVREHAPRILEEQERELARFDAASGAGTDTSATTAGRERISGR